jgi:hypothetical protein
MYKKGEDCQVDLVIPDTPIVAILLLQSCKKQVN